ncbi:microtubule-associated serine/threonine-protein kinase 3-like [Liolophura sinensis]|uniref:microtubule-associated serine/threonine-protein kinase 3-like n=1 Tax=Liolophura sinensis TaxID=3198878 RepID=UPI0031587632
MLWFGLGMDASKKHKKKKTHKEHKVKSVGDAFVQLDKDQAILTDADQNRRRRTLELSKKNNSWGFTLQTYGIRHKKSSQVEVMTYVDYVEIDSSAWFAGLRRGDVILAVDGDSVDHMTHQQLVDRLRQCQKTMRLVVLFEDCHRKVELHDRLIKLKTILKGKLQELKHLEEKERQILFKVPGLSRIDSVRLSARSSASSLDSTWDQYSIVYPTSACSSLANLSVSTTTSDEQDVLTDSLSMGSSVYSEDGSTSLDDGVVACASSDNAASETDSFTDSVFLPNNRSSVIFKPKFTVAPEGTDQTSVSTESSQGPSETSSDVPESKALPRIPSTPSAAEEGSPLLSPLTKEEPYEKISESDKSIENPLNPDNIVDDACVDQSNGATEPERHVTMNTESCTEKDKPKTLRFSQVRECINESDEVTKL